LTALAVGLKVDEIGDVLVGIGFGEAEHRYRMAHLGKAFGRRGTHPERRRILAHQTGEALFDGKVASPERIIFGVGDRRRVLGMVAPVMAGDLLGQPLKLIRGFAFAQRFDWFFRHSAVPGQWRDTINQDFRKIIPEQRDGAIS
jgi:hypothetical protein